jgi:MFS family permease
MNLNSQEKRTFLLLVLGAVGIGFIQSAFQMQDIVAKKTLNALDWQVTVLVMLWPLSNLFSIWWGKILEHSGSLSGYFLLLAFLGRLPLLLMIFVSSYYPFMGLMILMFSFNALMSPAQNTIFQLNFRKENRGTALGYMSSIMLLTALLVSYFAGKLLDLNESYFRYYFVVVAILGMIGALIYSRIKIRKLNRRMEKAFTSWRELLYGPVKRSLELLKSNKEFARFEGAYFIYGIGFMVLLPAIPKYLVDFLQMDYSQTFLAKGVLSQLGILLLAPLAGKIFSTRNPVQFNGFNFAFLSLYPTVLLLSSFFLNSYIALQLVYVAFIIFGIAMSGVHISWNISSIFFAGDEDVAMYQSVHVTLTGLRGMFAPFLGYALLELIGLRAVFITSMFMFILSSWLNFRQYTCIKKKVASPDPNLIVCPN